MADPVGERFHALVSGCDYPMFIVTAAAGADRDGCLVGFACQASIDPARLLVAELTEGAFEGVSGQIRAEWEA